MRVTGGRWAGRTLRAPRGDAVRPSSDRVRESLFAWLGDVEGARVLDLFAGTGALGIEALSRGARSALFVERAAAVRSVLRGNLERLGCGERARVVAGDAVRAVRRLAQSESRFDLVLLDPPYASDAGEEAMREVAKAGILVPGGTLIVECSRHRPPGAVPGLREAGEKRYGDTLVLRRVRVDPAGAEEGADP